MGDIDMKNRCWSWAASALLLLGITLVSPGCDLTLCAKDRGHTDSIEQDAGKVDEERTPTGDDDGFCAKELSDAPLYPCDKIPPCDRLPDN
jgi:hypothetical protein